VAVVTLIFLSVNQGVSTMKHIAIIFSVVLAVGVLVGCSKKEKAVMPPELTALAEQFKSAPGGEAKIVLGKQIVKLLPTCMREAPDGGFAQIDNTNPTYVLQVPALYALLGQPGEVEPDLCAYDLGRSEKAGYFLLIRFFDGYVSAAQIDVGK
jgi:hypothetical protein